jgi:hypothetical protein
MASDNFYIPRTLGKPTLRPSLLNGGVDTLGAQIFNILDSCVYHWIGGNNWEKDLTWRDTLKVLATQSYVNARSGVWGFITGNINNQLDLQAQFGTKVNYSDTTSLIATKFYVNNQAFTGDVLKPAQSLVTTISPNAVTFGKFQQMGPVTLLGNPTNGTANTQAVGLGVNGGLKMSGFNLIVDTTLIMPYTDTLRGLGIATKYWIQTQDFLNSSDSGKCSNCWVSGGTLYQVVDSLSLHSGVTSFNTRTGAVVPLAGDYTYAQVSNAAGLPANNVWSGSNTFNGSMVINFGEILNGVPTGLSSDSILTIINGVVRKIPSFSSTFLTFADTGKCLSCIVTGGGFYKSLDSAIVSATTGVTSFNGRGGIVIPRFGDYSYDSLAGNGNVAIDTVGTLIKGTWNASPIANAYLQNSSIGVQTDSTTTTVAFGSTPVSLGGTATLHVPSASTTARGVVTAGSQTFGGIKTFANGWVMGSNSTPSIDSTYALGQASFRFNNLYTALPAYGSGGYALAVENYTDGRMETIPASSLGINLSVGLIDSLSLVNNGAQVAGNRLIMQLATDNFPGLLDTGRARYIDSLINGLIQDTVVIAHVGGGAAGIWTAYAANNRTLVEKNLVAGYGETVTTQTDSSILIANIGTFASSRDTIFQTNIGNGSFPVLTPIYYNGSTWAKCDTTHPPQAVVSALLTTNTVEVTYNGKIVVSGGTGLTPGSTYFVTMPAGSISFPSPNESFPVGTATNSTTFIVSLQRPFNFNNLSGGGNPNVNIGTGFRLTVPFTNNVKTLNPGFGVGMDSVSGTNEITVINTNPAGIRDTIAQTAHGFTLGETVSRGASAWVAADTISNFPDGVVSKVIDANDFEVTYAGKFTWTSHGLTVGSIYYQSTTSGNVTPTSPVISIPVLKPISANVVLVEIKRPFNFSNTVGNSVVTVTSNYNPPTTYSNQTIIVNATAATVTLPDPTATSSQGIVYYIRALTSGQTVTVATAAGQIETSLGTLSSTATVTGIPSTSWISDSGNWRLK